MNGLGYSTYAFLHARLGALQAELLGARPWAQLLASSAFAEQRQVLAGTSYAEWVAAGVDATARSLPGAVDRLARKVESSVPPAAGRFVRVWRRRDLLRNVKTILKGKALGRSEAEIRSELLDVDPEHLLPAEALIRCTSLDAALDLLENTELRHWIREARRIYEQDPTLFGLDAALDRLYFPEVRIRLDGLDGADRAAIAPLLMLEIDQVNLQWLLRYRLNYGMSAAETYYLLVPATGRIGAEQLKLLVREDSLESVLAHLTVEPFRELLRDCQSTAQVEVSLRRLRARQARRFLREAAFTLGEAVALLVLKEIEVRDLIAVMEGSRLGAARDDIAEQLASVQPAN